MFKKSGLIVLGVLFGGAAHSAGPLQIAPGFISPPSLNFNEQLFGDEFNDATVDNPPWAVIKSPATASAIEGFGVLTLDTTFAAAGTPERGVAIIGLVTLPSQSYTITVAGQLRADSFGDRTIGLTLTDPFGTPSPTGTHELVLAEVGLFGAFARMRDTASAQTNYVQVAPPGGTIPNSVTIVATISYDSISQVLTGSLTIPGLGVFSLPINGVTMSGPKIVTLSLATSIDAGTGITHDDTRGIMQVDYLRTTLETGNYFMSNSAFTLGGIDYTTTPSGPGMVFFRALGQPPVFVTGPGEKVPADGMSDYFVALVRQPGSNTPYTIVHPFTLSVLQGIVLPGWTIDYPLPSDLPTDGRVYVAQGYPNDYLIDLGSDPCGDITEALNQLSALVVTITGPSSSAFASQLQVIVDTFNGGDYVNVDTDPLRNHVSAQRGKKVSIATADAVLALLDQIDSMLAGLIADGTTCTPLP